LLKAAKENAELLIVLEKKNNIAIAKAEVVGKEQAIAQKKQEEVAKIKGECD